MSPRLRIVATVATTLLIAACIDSRNLDADAAKRPAGAIPASTQSLNDSDMSIDISGTYVSEITSNHPWYYANPHRQLVVTVRQLGNDFSAEDDLYGTRIEGQIDGNKASFVVLPGLASGFNATAGRWTIDAAGSHFEGRWWAKGHRADGQWNLRRFDHEKVELYTLESGIAHPFNLSQSDIFFDSLFTASAPRNIVFYIHGRGERFNNLFQPSMVPNIEAYSNTRFALIHWLSWNGAGNRPYRRAMRSAAGLADFLFALDEYKTTHSEQLKDRKLILLAHSMGGIPLRVFAQDYYSRGKLQPGLFDSIIINSADMPAAGHADWVEQIDFADSIYIVQNRGDLILYFSEHYFEHYPGWGGPRLGSGSGIDVEDDVASDRPAQNALYLDLTNLSGNGHRHFNMPLQERDSKVNRLFTRLLNAQPLAFPDPNIGLFERSDSGQVYYFHNRDPAADFPFTTR